MDSRYNAYISLISPRAHTGLFDFFLAPKGLMVVSDRKVCLVYGNGLLTSRCWNVLLKFSIESEYRQTAKGHTLEMFCFLRCLDYYCAYNFHPITVIKVSLCSVNRYLYR